MDCRLGQIVVLHKGMKTTLASLFLAHLCQMLMMSYHRLILYSAWHLLSIVQVYDIFAEATGPIFYHISFEASLGLGNESLFK